MFTKSSTQLSPRRSHFYIDNDLLDSDEDRIAMIYVTAARLDSMKERWVGSKSRKKQYAFVLNLEWSDGSSSVVWRSYTDFFEFQCQLLDSFPEEAGSVRGCVRIIPYLPGIFKMAVKPWGVCNCMCFCLKQPRKVTLLARGTGVVLGGRHATHRARVTRTRAGCSYFALHTRRGEGSFVLRNN